MKVSKWVDMGAEVDVEIGVDDVRAALGEAFSRVTQEHLGEEGPSAHDVKCALYSIGTFLNAMTDEHIALLEPKPREIVRAFLFKNAERF